MTNDTLTSDPKQLAIVADRKAFIGYALDKQGVPLDGYTPAAMLDMAFLIANTHGKSPKWIVKMLRDYANAIELHYSGMDGPKQ